MLGRWSTTAAPHTACHEQLSGATGAIVPGMKKKPGCSTAHGDNTARRGCRSMKAPLFYRSTPARPILRKPVPQSSTTAGLSIATMLLPLLSRRAQA